MPDGRVVSGIVAYKGIFLRQMVCEFPPPVRPEPGKGLISSQRLGVVLGQAQDERGTAQNQRDTPTRGS